MRRLTLAICGCLLGTALLAPGSAAAAVTCVGPAPTLTVATTGTTVQVSVDVDSTNGQIRAYEGGIGAGADACAAVDASTTNLDSIEINTAAGAADSVALVSLQGGRFGPGATDEGGAPASEVEIDITAAGGTDQFELDGADSADDVDLGQAVPGTIRANLNAASDAATPDCTDITGSAIENVIVRGRGGDDDVNATACNGIGGAVPLDPDSLQIEGNNQADVLRGGPGADSVLGGTQDDNVKGGDGNDSVDGERDDDKVEGGAAADAIEGGTEVDRVLYDDRTTPLSVTVGSGGADDGGAEDQSGGSRDNVGFSVEHVTGGSAGDVIVGSSARNVLNGGLGDDVLNGLDGNDDLEGEGGNDTMDGGGGNDEVRGSDGNDTGNGGAGADDLFGGASVDRLFGGAGADFIKGDKGKDVHSGQAGNDKLNAKDRKRDKKISCGKGKAAKESAKVDKQDPKAQSC